MSDLFLFKVGVLVLITLVNTSVLSEVDSINHEQVINLRQAIANTIEGNPELTSLGYQLQSQEGLLQHAGLAPNPKLRMEFENLFGTGDFNDLDRLEATLSIGWVLEHAVRKQQVDVAQAGVSLLNTEVEIARIDSAVKTARRFLICLANQERLLNKIEALELAEDAVNAVQKRVSVGKAPRAELAGAQANLALKKLERDDVEHDVKISYRKLAAQWGEIEPQFKEVVGNLSSLPKIESFEVLKDRLGKNPEFARLMSIQRVNEAELRLAQEMGKPLWEVSAGVRHFEDLDDQALVLDFSVPLTLKNRNQGRIASTQAKIDKLNADNKLTYVRINTQLFELYQELQHSLHRATAFRDVIIPATSQASKDSMRAYERGRYSYLEWQAVQANLLDSKQELLEATISAHLHVIEIERVTGVNFIQ